MLDKANPHWLLGVHDDPYRNDYYTLYGKANAHDVGRVLYTLAEAAQYGWYNPEPMRVEFESYVGHAEDGYGGVDMGGGALPDGRTPLYPFIGKRVRVTVEELP
jgi:hypothetical protein